VAEIPTLHEEAAPQFQRQLCYVRIVCLGH
jgi:hypothetical protein